MTATDMIMTVIGMTVTVIGITVTVIGITVTVIGITVIGITMTVIGMIVTVTGMDLRNDRNTNNQLQTKSTLIVFIEESEKLLENIVVYAYRIYLLARIKYALLAY
ncbi:hypothetical protein LOAG_11981 [Loa loa]|uniref:Uncharacterized protein n=1 Tax=Loa loa TaxID=7209 RepID=A0A1S0TM13_LOALO|nr:hypothetical protein LOAG_11981 [Loa loa]EFO16525.1 hypothetical protein LOAG_11981 [Loa loa]